MKTASLSLLTLLAAAMPAAAQTDVLYTIDRPAGVLHAWAANKFGVADLNADGIEDIALADRTHGGGVIRLFSGADGSSLYDINVGQHILFFGRGVTSINDQNGDGVAELAVAGFQSGDANSPEGRLHIYSGADGAVIRELAAPTNVSFREGGILALDDADGDGFEDILVRTSSFLVPDIPTQVLFSSVTGQMLYGGFSDPSEFFVLQSPIKTSDHDGDGHADFLCGVVQGFQGTRSVQVRSGRTGEVLSDLNAPGFNVITGNGEPLVGLADRDGDGLDDFAIGGVFTGYIGVFSSADASLMREWACGTNIGCIGSSLVNAGDLNGDGHEDLITVETNNFGAEQVGLVGLDIETGSEIFHDPISGTLLVYGGSDAFIPMPNVDPQGFPGFAFFDTLNDQMSVRRFAFEQVGANYCVAAVNSTGAGAEIRAAGSPSVAQNDLFLTAFPVPAGQPGLFFYGGGQISAPFGDGVRCVGSAGIGVFRLPIVTSTATGQFHHLVDNTSPSSPAGALSSGSTWNFQGWYRDPAAMGASFNLTDGIEIVFEP